MTKQSSHQNIYLKEGTRIICDGYIGILTILDDNNIMVNHDVMRIDKIHEIGRHSRGNIVVAIGLFGAAIATIVTSQPMSSGDPDPTQMT